MAASANQLRWNGRPGHYEVYYVTLNDPATGIGLWLRYTLLAPVTGSGREPSCALWLAAMDPRPGSEPRLARKATFPIGELDCRRDPFELRLGPARLSDGEISGEFADVAWELTWTPAPQAAEPVSPRLHSLGLAQTALVLPAPDALIEGWVRLGERRLELTGARGGQAHLWGTEHARTWAWAHCNQLLGPDGDPAVGMWFDGVSAVVSRLGRQVGPNTPMVGGVASHPFQSTSLRRILTNRSSFGLEGWRFETADSRHRLVGQVRSDPEQLVGVTYEDPDGEKAYCYNTETASVRLEVYERRRGRRGWVEAGTLDCEAGCHFEYGLRRPLPGVELLVR